MKANLRKDLSKKELKETYHAIECLAPIQRSLEDKEQVEHDYEGIEDFARLVKISVISAKGEPTPILADRELERLFEILFHNMVNENTRKPRKSLHIIASFEFPQDQFDFIMTHDLDKTPKEKQ